MSEIHNVHERRVPLPAAAAGAMRVLWPLVWQPLHDALIEDAFDRAAGGRRGRWADGSAACAQPSDCASRQRFCARSIDWTASSRGYQPSTLTTFHSGVL